MATAVQSAEHTEHALWQPAVNPWLIAIAVILPTFMEVLDTSIANVALNHIAGSMSASYSQATWVLTSYLISNAVILPLTAWLGNRFQRKRFLLFCIFLFTASSLLCGLSVNLPMLLFMRVLQGLGGGALAPISQAILMESFPPKRQGIAQAVFGLGVVVAPVIGPVLGGWLTDSYSWRWIFYINIPVGLLAMWAIQQTVEDPPWVSKSDPGPMDGIGLIALALWLGCQEVALDKGQEDDWLGSRFICTMIVLAIVGFVVFLVRELRAEKPMVDLHIFRERNLAVGTVLIFLTSVLMYGISLLTPQFLQQLMGYTAYWAGIATVPLGLGAAVSMIVVGILVSRVDARWLTMLGFAIFASAAYLLSHINLSIALVSLYLPQFLAGGAMGLLFIPVNVAATAPLRRDQLGTATGCINLMRNVGGSVGIAMVSTFLARRAQFHQTVLSGDITSSSASVLQQVTGPMRHLLAHAAGPANSLGASLGLLYQVMLQQAALLSFRDNYLGLCALAIISIFIVLALRKVKADKSIPLH
jgi:MFS transporter, DHA2 family, multidrug resistance protein